MIPAAEIAAVILGLVYLLLAIRQRRSCWVYGGLASLLFLAVFWHAGLPMQALLQLYYAAIAVHGWLYWGREDAGKRTPVRRERPRFHVAAVLALTVLATATVGFRGLWDDPQAWLDATSSWGGVIATWMLARKILDAWIYWILIDALTVILYIEAGLLPSSALYMLYTVLAISGWRQWLDSFRRQPSN